MNEKLFRGIILTLLILGILSVIALTVYTILLQQNCSIISYIANGR